jgi:2-methylcitrate dehydratase PrpD
MGRGAQNGLLAAQLASHGFESCPKAIESWARLVSSTVNEHEISALARAGRYQILENTYKPYPCGIVIHPLIDAALHAHADMGLSQSQRLAGGSDFLLGIQSIEAFVNPQCVRLCSIRHPKTGLETIFSLYHGIAVALVHGKAGPEEFSDAGCRDELTMQLRDKIRVHIDPDIADDAATLRIVLLGVDQREYHVAHAAGSLAKPMSSKQLEEKFLLLSSPILGKARATELVARCWALDRENDVQNFVQMLAASIDVLDE